MKAVAFSGVALLPAPLRPLPRHGAEIEHTRRFTPGLLVKVLLESGGEEGALLRWAE